MMLDGARTQYIFGRSKRRGEPVSRGLEHDERDRHGRHHLEDVYAEPRVQSAHAVAADDAADRVDHPGVSHAAVLDLDVLHLQGMSRGS